MMNKPLEELQISEGKIFALLSYLSILCILPLIFKKDNEFVLKHGKQGLVLFVGEVGIFIVHLVVGVWFLKIGMFLIFLFSFCGIVAVLQSRYVELPIVSVIAEKIIL